MEKPDNSETLPVDVSGSSEIKDRKLSNRKAFWPLVGLAMALVIIILGALIGVQTGINRRLAQEESSISRKAGEQFELGLIDLQNQRYENAQERFEYVLRLNPEYPGAAEKLYEVLYQMNSLKTPTVTPTPTPTRVVTVPLPETGGADILFQKIQDAINNKQWSEAIDLMDQLRKLDLTYQPVSVDGLYYIALRNRGVEKILQLGELEQGIYDLSLAERFALLDKDADSYRTWARLYLTGASYWDINWEQVVYYFSQIQPAFPNLRDGSGMTATERLRKGLIKYADQVASTGDVCGALAYYEQAMALGSDPVAQPTYVWIGEKCWETQNPPSIPEETTAAPVFTPTPTLTPTPEGQLTPGETPTPEPTP